MPIIYNWNRGQRAKALNLSFVPMVRRSAPPPSEPPPPPPKPKLKPLKDFKQDHRVELVEKIIADVAHKCGVSVADIKSTSRDRAVAWARQDAMYEVYRRVHVSMPKLGRYFDREHTTVLHSINRAEERWWIKQAIYKALEGKLNVVLDDWDKYPANKLIPADRVDRPKRSVRTSLRRAREEATQVTD